MTDSTRDTIQHIETVRKYLGQVIQDLETRALDHDASKLVEPEKSAFDEHSATLSSVKYGSPEYDAAKEALGPALDHHYRHNRHHPEHHVDGVYGMNLIDLVEMLADWKAASERVKDGDLEDSIYKNAVRFNINKTLRQLLIRTALELGWIPRKPSS